MGTKPTDAEAMHLSEERPTRAGTTAWLIVLGMFVASATIIASCMGGAYVFMRGGTKGKEAETGQTLSPSDPVEVLLAVQEIPAGALMTQPEVLFAPKSFAKGAEPAGAITDLDQLRGRVLVRKLQPGDFCTRQDLAGDNGYVGRLQTGLRAMGVRAISEGNKFLLPGCRVDILAREQGTADKVKHRVLLENVLVLALAHQDKLTDDEKRSDPNMQVTLAVTAEQAVKLADAMVGGPVRLVVHPPRADNDE